ncbi:MAG: hypothetical protein ACRDPE_12500 [Solirubrobacterales bacterium]
MSVLIVQTMPAGFDADTYGSETFATMPVPERQFYGCTTSSLPDRYREVPVARGTGATVRSARAWRHPQGHETLPKGI